MKAYVAVDWSYRKRHWVHTAAEQSGYEVEIVDTPNYNTNKLLKKWHKPVEMWNAFRIAHQAVTKAEPGELFIGVNFLSAVFAAILDRRHKLTILGIDILTHKNKSIAGRLRNALYKRAFRHPRLYGTCNTQAALDIVAEFLGETVRERFFILHDPMRFERSLPEGIVIQNYCFSGGASGRDWKTLQKVSELCPDIPFVVAAASRSWDDTVHFPKNVKLYFDLPEPEFDRLLMESAVMAIPLKSEMTSGLLVLFKGIEYKKPVVATNIEAVANYYPENASWLLCERGNAQQMAMKIEECIRCQNSTLPEQVLAYNKEKNSIDVCCAELGEVLNTIQNRK